MSASSSKGGMWKRKTERTTYKAKRKYAKVVAPAVLIGHKETKCVDLPVTNLLISATATITPLNLTAAGAAFNQRVGRRIEMKSLQIRGSISIDPAAAAANVSDFWRVMLVYDRQPNGALPAITDILQDVDNAGAATTTSYSFPNYNNMDRFKTLKMWTWGIGTDATGGAGARQQWFDYNKAELEGFMLLKGLECHYSGDTAVIGAVSTGTLLLVTMGNIAAANAFGTLKVNTRVRYTDN